jgi:EmrB/QacA subfamily drug resistance transporter
VTDAAAGAASLRFGTPAGRWVIAAAVLGSGVAFLDSTVVNAALPAIGSDLHAGLADLQWVLTAYLLTLGSFLVVGGSLGDRYGRRKLFVIGLVGFAMASALCGAAPSIGVLIAARAVQGVAAALLVPESLAIISASFHPDDRGRAIGAWSGLGGVATAGGPFLGGWLIDTVSWRLVFFINLPLVAAAVAIALRHVPETRDEDAPPHLDVPGALLLAGGLAGVVYALIEGPSKGWPTGSVVLGLAGLFALVSWVVVERRVAHPMVPLDMFKSRQFSGANAVTFAIYGAFGATTFLLVVHLQTDLGYSALAAGASIIPATVLMLLFSARSGALAQRIGPRMQMTVGPLVTAIGIALLARVEPGRSYWDSVLPAMIVIGIGITMTVAPLTAAVLAAVDDHHAGLGSAVNNAVARIASLVAIAVLPAVAGISTAGGSLNDGFGTAMGIAAGVCAVGGVLGFVTIRRSAPVRVVTRGDLFSACEDPCVRLERAS